MTSKFAYYNMLAMLMVRNMVTVRNFMGTTEKLERGVMTILIAVAMHQK
jgi:hypothetical protein